MSTRFASHRYRPAVARTHPGTNAARVGRRGPSRLAANVGASGDPLAGYMAEAGGGRDEAGGRHVRSLRRGRKGTEQEPALLVAKARDASPPPRYEAAKAAESTAADKAMSVAAEKAMTQPGATEAAEEAASDIVHIGGGSRRAAAARSCGHAWPEPPRATSPRLCPPLQGRTRSAWRA